MNLTFLGRRLTYGVGGWLQFEFYCHRSELFSEKYLSFPIGQILNAYFGPCVYAEVKHPVLAKNIKGPGRRPEVDFAVLDPYPNFKVAIESKWVGKNNLSIESIVWDLIRLEFIAHHSNARVFFLLAGKKRWLDELFDSDGFSGPGEELLRTKGTPGKRGGTIRLDTPKAYRANIFRNVLLDYQTMKIPSRICTEGFFPFPEKCNTNEYQVFTWEISCAKPREEFLPSKHSLYRK